MLRTPDKVFVNVKGADHSEPVESHRMGPFISAYSRLYALGDDSASTSIFGDGAGSIRGSVPIAGPTDANVGGSGNKTFGFLGCRRGEKSIPADLDEFCA